MTNMLAAVAALIAILSAVLGVGWKLGKLIAGIDDKFSSLDRWMVQLEQRITVLERHLR
jgi:hypothetical protein